MSPQARGHGIGGRLLDTALAAARAKGAAPVLEVITLNDFYVLLNVAVGGTASRRPDSSVSFPQTMLVDYVRVAVP